MCTEIDEEVWSEEEVAEFKKRGPFTHEVSFSAPYKDFFGRTQRIKRFPIKDAEGKVVAFAGSVDQARFWAKELTENGCIED